MAVIAQPLPTGKQVASIQDVSHRYGKVLALDGISLDIPSGIRVGIIGPDGVGKSTLLALVAGSKKLQQGQVLLLNRSGNISARSLTVIVRSNPE